MYFIVVSVPSKVELADMGWVALKKAFVLSLKDWGDTLRLRNKLLEPRTSRLSTLVLSYDSLPFWVKMSNKGQNLKILK